MVYKTAVIVAASALCGIYEAATDGRPVPEWLVDRLEAVEKAIRTIDSTLNDCKLPEVA